MAALDVIQESMDDSGLPYQEAKGDAAFYGPKIDFIIKSAIGTEYAISTNQLDFLATERFGLTYRGEDAKDYPVYVIHRAPLGSHERFIAFLLEHYKGAFPVWLAPVQVVVIPVSEKFTSYAAQVYDRLMSSPVRNGSLGFRVELDATSDRMQKKVRNALVRKIPLVLVVGGAEEAAESVALRTRSGADLGQVGLSEFIDVLRAAVEQRDDTPFQQHFGGE
ncbi:His/Gly/Thr/Pro-type tRNA ligase C-terminal domain-containing protein, partial [Frankia sp. Cppng1_Ct_nod]|uniref:His/Gly/Thr/Pro-type tRNA ligase C-terminal domain-containing protein n=1 Tax=Frankia sp. Cppng1_Ct_nod TaxID=2897162 RepID=UPI002025706A